MYLDLAHYVTTQCSICSNRLDWHCYLLVEQFVNYRFALPLK